MRGDGEEKQLFIALHEGHSLHELRARCGCHVKKDGFKASLIMTCTSNTVQTHLQRCRTLGEGLLKLC